MKIHSEVNLIYSIHCTHMVGKCLSMEDSINELFLLGIIYIHSRLSESNLSWKTMQDAFHVKTTQTRSS